MTIASEESPWRCNISMLAQKEVNRVALLIYGTIEIPPFTLHSDVCFVDTPR